MSINEFTDRLRHATAHAKSEAVTRATESVAQCYASIHAEASSHIVNAGPRNMALAQFAQSLLDSAARLVDNLK